MKVQDLLEGIGKFAHWPETFMLYGPYVAVRAAEEDRYVMYKVHELMSDETKMELSASVIPPGDKYFDKYAVSYKAGYNRNFAQRIGTRATGFDFSTFKKWAIGATQAMVANWLT
jgi:hypothetical protein